MTREEWHRHQGEGVRWRLTPDGVEVEGTGIERTKGRPATATRVWEAFAAELNAVAVAKRIPCALLVATVCVESGGDPRALRTEPGWVDDSRTPHKVSAGLTQTLLSTAALVVGRPVTREWLFEPRNALDAGAGYIDRQRAATDLDPPLVAAAYNAGGLYPDVSAANRWRLRQYPRGTSEHGDRFVRFFNDAVAVLRAHAVRPAFDYADLARRPQPAPRA